MSNTQKQPALVGQVEPSVRPAAWIVRQGSRTYYVSDAEFVRSSYDTGSFTPLYAQPTEPDFTAPMIEAIYAAWHGAGVDIAGGNWARFVGMLPRA
jgi:hypothetical protein